MKTIIAAFFLFSTTLFAAEKLEIIKIGHPVLRAQAQEIEMSSIADPKFQKLIDDMVHTMKKSGGVGLADPQVNQSIRMFVMGRRPDVPLTVVINPKIEYLEPEG